MPGALHVHNVVQSNLSVEVLCKALSQLGLHNLGTRCEILVQRLHLPRNVRVSLCLHHILTLLSLQAPCRQPFYTLLRQPCCLVLTVSVMQGYAGSIRHQEEEVASTLCASMPCAHTKKGIRAPCLLLCHQDGNPLIVKLRAPSSPDHLQDGAAIILLIAGHISLVTHPATCALQDHQMRWKVDTLSQRGCCAEDLHASQML